MLARLIIIALIVIVMSGCGKGDYAPNLLFQDTVKYAIKYPQGKLSPNFFSYTVRTATDTSFTAYLNSLNHTLITWFNTGDTIRAIYADSLTITYNSKKMTLRTYTYKGYKYGYFLRP